MIELKLWGFNKAPNSTQRPTTAGKRVQGSFKGAVSTLEPVVELKPTDWENDICIYNYAYISEFKRYYYITDVVYDTGIWTLYLQVDVLGSYQQQIGETSAYVVRSSSNYHGEIIDDLYPATTDIEQTDRYFTMQLMNPTTGSPSYVRGVFVIGVLGIDANYLTTPGITYYVLAPGQYAQLLNTFYSSSTSWGDLAANVINSIKKIDQYIMCAYWYPNNLYIPKTTESYTIYLGSFDTGIAAPKITGELARTYTNTPIVGTSVPKHPQARNIDFTYLDATYLNASPFSQYTLSGKMLGEINIPSEYLLNAVYFCIYCTIDVTCGKGRLYMLTKERTQAEPNPSSYFFLTQGSTTEKLIYTTDISFGIPINLAATTVDARGLLQSTAGAVGSAVTGNWLGATASIGNAAVSMTPTPGSISYGDTLIDMTDGRMTLRGTFKKIVGVDNRHRGRPFCETITLKYAPGYIEVADAEFTGSSYIDEEPRPTTTERQQIESFMESGFYYEQ